MPPLSCQCSSKILFLCKSEKNDPIQVHENIASIRGSILMAENKLYEAYDVFSTVIELDPVWAEGWNKRATVLYLMGKYLDSLNAGIITA